MKLSDIDASLEYGWNYSKKLMVWIYICFFMGILFPLISLGVFFTEPASDDDIILVIAMNIVGGVVLVFFGALLLYKMLLNKKMKEWITDAIEMHAYAQKLDDRRLILKATKIQVKFCLQKKWYTKVSGNGKWYRQGYSTIFTKYADRKINILYSPKYDQVMILKDK